MALFQRALRRTTQVGGFIALSALIGCGPSITSPASNDLSGAWASTGSAAGLSSVLLQLTQSSDGTLTGSYQAMGTASFQFCPATPPCSISGTISGSNTVLQIFFELKDAGQFSGQLIDGNTMKGAMSRVGVTEAMQFTRSRPLIVFGTQMAVLPGNSSGQ